MQEITHPTKFIFLSSFIASIFAWIFLGCASHQIKDGMPVQSNESIIITAATKVPFPGGWLSKEYPTNLLHTKFLREAQGKAQFIVNYLPDNY